MKRGTYKKLSSRLKALRKRHQITQEQCAELAGLFYKFYQSIEAGRRKDIRFTTLEKIASVFSIQVYQLLSPRIPRYTCLYKKPFKSLRRKPRV